jgi:cephalosporin hydroxylase
MRTWVDIEGWFTFEDVYREEAKKCTDDSILVELGVWKGKSIAFLATEILSLKKKPRLFAVDTWAGSDDEPEHQKEVTKLGGPEALYNEFCNNMRACGVDGIVHPIQKKSLVAAKMFDDESIDFLYIDASHTYEDVLADIKAWLPKIKKGGVIAGHDIKWPDVKKAVKESFETYEQRGDSWRKQC